VEQAGRRQRAGRVAAFRERHLPEVLIEP
jgi:hypothetical protein